MTDDPHFKESVGGDLFLGQHMIPPDLVHHVRFYLKHPTLVFPHRHATKNGLGVTHLDLSCDSCGKAVPPELIHGLINDYAHCIEIRFVAPCPQCAGGRPRVIHNVLRFRGDGEMDFMRDGVWMRTTTWWKWLRHRMGF